MAPQTLETLPENWIETAASYGATKWLQQFIRFYLSELQAGRLSPEAFANELEEEFASRNLKTAKQQKNYRSNVVQALKVLDSEHPAIALVGLSTAQYRALNDEQKARIADRETQFIDKEIVGTIVEIAEHLLESEEWSDVGAGLAILIGRRISEILLSEFSLKTAWSLNFSGMAKKADDIKVTIEIPTLAPAEKVLSGIQRLQNTLAISDLRLNSLSEREAKRKVNQKYSGAIAQKCDEYFREFVPIRTDRDTLYTHLFRAVYATIAAYWFCPTSVPEHQFKSEIQGHFSLTQDGQKLPNYSARSNYDDYAIGDGQGNRDGRLGIQLGHLPGVEVIEAFQPIQIPKSEASEQKADAETTHDEPSAPSHEMSTPEQPTTSLNLYTEDIDLMNELMAKRGVSGTTAEVFRALLETFISEMNRRQIEALDGVGQTLNWFTQEIDTLRQQYRALEQEHQRSSSLPMTTSDEAEEVAALEERNAQLEEQLDEMTSLETRNAQLEKELQDTQTRLNGIQQLLGGNLEGSKLTPTAATPQTAQTPPSVKPDSTDDNDNTKQRDRSDSLAKIADVIDAIIKWNTAQERSELRLRISFPSVKSLALLVGAGYQSAIKEVMDKKKTEIDEIHQRYTIGSRHNRSVTDKDEVLRTIARDYLGFPNWQEAEYTT
ncbi:MAG: protelomerase family protein [Leptolyngbyaceae cyanobacterium]